MGKKLDLVGQRFGRLIVLCKNGRNQNDRIMWKCRCDCGNEVTVRSDNLRNGHTTSCGCYSRECLTERHTKHGLSSSRLYYVWQSMLQRTGVTKCSNAETRRNYQDRGISVCNEWKTFENFRDWAFSNGFADDLQIDRIDNNCGYCPENCRWTTAKENTNNRRNTLRLEDGASLAMFCSEVGIQTRENGKISRQYNRIRDAYRKSHKIHPELLARANEYLNTLRKLKASLDLLSQIREFREKCNVWKTSLKKT